MMELIPGAIMTMVFFVPLCGLMQNNTIRKNVPAGTHVMVVKKEDQRTGN
jgi:hypothetical protein